MLANYAVTKIWDHFLDSPQDCLYFSCLRTRSTTIHAQKDTIGSGTNYCTWNQIIRQIPPSHIHALIRNRGNNIMSA